MTSRIRPSLLRQLNVRRILEAVRERGPLSRADVTRQLGISPPTVSGAVASLLEAGLLAEEDATPTGPGRPGRLLRLGSDRVQVVGVALDKDRTVLAAAGLDGTVRPPGPVELATPGSYEELLDLVASAAADLTAGPAATVGVGVSVPGQINRRTGAALFSPNLHLTDGRTPAADLAARAGLGVPCVLVQESHALCLGERWHGVAGGLDDFAVLDVTTGLGLGVMSGGRLLAGHSGLAGELGHVTAVLDGRPCGCGNRGCLETVATDSALLRAAGERLGRPVTMDEYLTLPPGPELGATLEYLAVAAAAVLNVFNPATLFVYGRMLDAGGCLLDDLRGRVGRRALRASFADCAIERARATKVQGAVAAAVHQLTRSLAPAVDAG